MKDEKLINSKGLHISKITAKDETVSIKKLSDLGENWEINSECPTCNRLFVFRKDNVNKLLKCKCGQKLFLEIPTSLL